MQLLAKISELFTGRKSSPFDVPAVPFTDATGIQTIGLNRRSRTLKYNTESSFRAYLTHELVYSCINKIADVMNDAEIIVEIKDKDGNWQKKEGHLLPALLKRPNRLETGRDFRRMMVQSEQATGIFYGQITRSGAGIPVEIHPLNPLRLQPWPNLQTGDIAFYRYTRPDGKFFDIIPEDMLIRRRADITNRFFGSAPLDAALKSINSDIGLTDYVDAFFESDGTPSGILKILNATVSETKREALQAKWKQKYSRGGANQKGIAVLDQNAEFQKIGSNLNELDTEKISARFESRICSVFGVPPILVSAWVGLQHTTANATAKAALRDFWDNKIQPELAALREWYTWFLLPEFENIDAIKAERVRVGWDTSHVGFLQEDADGLHTRARENFKAGMWTLNEAREATGMPPDEVSGADYYVQPLNVIAVSPQVRAIEADKEPQAPPPQLQQPPPANPVPDPNAEPVPPKALPEHIEKKTFDFNGLTVGREPHGVELVIDLKKIVSDLESEKQKVISILSKFRVDLIKQTVEKLDKLTVETAHTLTLTPDPKRRKEILKALKSAYMTGRAQIRAEIAAQQAAKSGRKAIEDLNVEDLTDAELIDLLDHLDELTDGLISRIINEITTRGINEYLTEKLLDIYTTEKLELTLEDQSEKFLEQAAGNAVNAAISEGRDDEIQAQKDVVEYTEYSAVLDANTCGPCGDADGEQAEDPANLPAAPNPDCDGGDRCRCIHVAVIV
jgi:HK97 family phage portal protein